jgi:hypothetical protein
VITAVHIAAHLPERASFDKVSRHTRTELIQLRVSPPPSPPTSANAPAMSADGGGQGFVIVSAAGYASVLTSGGSGEAGGGSPDVNAPWPGIAAAPSRP